MSDLVMDRFRLLERIGSGGMGTVYRAFDERLQREVAVKEVNGGDPDRILREAQAAARLNHPGIVTLYELGERDGHALLVSELVPGATLDRLRGEGELCDRDVGELGCDLCDALAHAHARGVVHRDLKPPNVIVRDDATGGRRAKLMDFGIARVAGAPTLTVAGEVVGTLAYMSPEQAEGLTAGPESDVYSLALTLYECWAGVNPVAGRTPAETARRIGEPLPSLREYRADLPETLVAAVDVALHPRPDVRPTPAGLRESLERALEDLDPERAVPVLDDSGSAETRSVLDLSRVAVLVGLCAGLALIAGPLGAAGLALVLATLLLPAALVAPGWSAASGPGSAILGALGAAVAAPALAASVCRRPFERALLGAATWAWAFAAAAVAGAGERLGIAARAPDGWAFDAGVAADSVLAPLLEPQALLGAAIFAAAAVALGAALAARHLATALLGAMLWAAALDSALKLVGDGALGGRPLLTALAGAAAVAAAFALRDGGRRSQPRPVASGDPALSGGRVAGRLA